MQNITTTYPATSREHMADFCALRARAISGASGGGIHFRRRMIKLGVPGGMAPWGSPEGVYSLMTLNSGMFILNAEHHNYSFIDMSC
jgi:hypothetical protein